MPGMGGMDGTAAQVALAAPAASDGLLMPGMD